MRRQTTSMRTPVVRMASLAPGLVATGPVFAAYMMAEVDWHSCLDRHSYTYWHRLLLVASVVLLVAAFVRNTCRTASSPDDAKFTHGNRIGNMPIEPPAPVESVR